MKNTHKFSEIIYSESFGEGNRHYFYDICRARNNSLYIRLTRSDKIGANKYKREKLIIFEEDWMFSMECKMMAMRGGIQQQLELEAKLTSGPSPFML